MKNTDVKEFCSGGVHYLFFIFIKNDPPPTHLNHLKALTGEDQYL